MQVLMANVKNVASQSVLHALKLCHRRHFVLTAQTNFSADCDKAACRAGLKTLSLSYAYRYRCDKPRHGRRCVAVKLLFGTDTAPFHRFLIPCCYGLLQSLCE